ncbi:MAG: S-layer homology domain-containing protein [Anaerotignum sp.]|nr:S-layer homology domain-containing protein [Anaerotignum sp.]
MMKKFIGFLLSFCLLFSVSTTVFAANSYTLEKIKNTYSVLTGEVTKISEDRIKLSKISDALWSDIKGAQKADYIILDTTGFENTKFCDGDIIRAYFITNFMVDYRSEIDVDDYAFELLAYQRNDQEISVEEMAEFLEGIGVLNGYEDGELHLERNITRAEFTSIMMKIFGVWGYNYETKIALEGTTFPFKDVPKDHWARESIIYAFANGMISGKSGDTFAPDENITIRDCIVVLLKANTKYEDQRQLLLDVVKTLGGYPDGYLKIAKENGLITDQLPDKIATRGEVAKILYNAYNHEANMTYLTAAKPVIYLYPQKDTDATVEVSFDGDFTFTYPEYKDSWAVTARPDGTLISGTTEYPYLFWEGKVMNYSPKFDEGFLVSKKETVSFLEEKLERLGLNEKERADFITYWAPQLIKNDYNIIKFDTEEYASKVSLNITPQPDSMIRVFMVYKAANGNESIKKQELNSVERNGFVAVEWGGALEE